MGSDALRVAASDGTTFLVDAEAWDSECRVELAPSLFFEGVPSQYAWQAKHKRHTTYIVRNVSSKFELRLHRAMLSAVAGDIVDHIDGNGLNNTRANLRIVTPAENAQNRNKVTARSGYKGVHRLKRGTYHAHIRVNKRKVHLGTYRTAEEAALAYDAAAAEYFGEFASLNFPEALASSNH